MAEEWYFLIGSERRGPVTHAALIEEARSGAIIATTLVWRHGLAEWVPASKFPELQSLFPVPSAPPPPAPGPEKPTRSFLGGVGARISDAAELPTISNVPVSDIFVGGLKVKAGEEDIEEEFIVGTRSTTPALQDIASVWPTPRVFWRILAGSVLTYFLLYLGIRQFGNFNFVPGLIVIGSFVVPFSVVILFFELNTPRNVSIYQVGKLLMLGGALSLITTMFLFDFIPGSGVGALLPAMLTGVIEETGKALALLMVVTSRRYRWQLNGVLFGAAIGAGFAGFESAGYALRAMLDSGSMDVALDLIMLRALLSPGGHIIWTAMVGSALWKVKGDAPFQMSMFFHRDVLRRWAIAVILHGLWDANLLIHPYIKLAILVVVGWYLILAILKQALGEVAVAKEALG